MVTAPNSYAMYNLDLKKYIYKSRIYFFIVIAWWSKEGKFFLPTFPLSCPIEWYLSLGPVPTVRQPHCPAVLCKRGRPPFWSPARGLTWSGSPGKLPSLPWLYTCLYCPGPSCISLEGHWPTNTLTQDILVFCNLNLYHLEVKSYTYSAWKSPICLCS